MIWGERFILLADYIFRPYGGDNPFNHIPKGDYRYLENTLDFDRLKDGDVIYTHTFYIPQLFERLKGKVTVISHNCDTAADVVPPEGVTWYSSNVNIIHPRVIPLPYGIKENVIQKMVQKIQEKKTLNNLLYIDHRIWVNPEERIRPYELLENKPWVTAIHTEGTNEKFTHETPESFDRYLDNLYHHAFSICPPGNGIDTRRPWEALYMRTIPIVKKSIHNLSFDEFPIVYVDDWSEVTLEFLLDKYYEVGEYYPQLDFDYWKGLIYENSRANGRAWGKI